MAEATAVDLTAVSLANVAANSLSRQQTKSYTDASGDFSQYLKSNDTDRNLASSDRTKKDTLQSPDFSDREKVSGKEKFKGKNEDATAQEGFVFGGNAEKFDKVISQIRNELKDAFRENLSVDENTLKSTLNSLGMTFTDMADKGNVMQLVLAVNGKENVDFLTDENLMENFTGLAETLDVLADRAGALDLDLFEVFDEPMALDEFMAQNPELNLESGMTQAQPQEPLTENSIALSGDTPIESVTVTVEKPQEEVLPVPLQVAAEGKPQEPDAKAENGQGQTNADVLPVSSTADSTGESENAASGNGFSKESFDAGAFDFDGEQEEKDVDLKTDAEILFADRFDAVSNNPAQNLQAEQSALGKMQQMIDIISQVTDTITSKLNANTTTVQLQLQPESLGRVLISVASKQGVMTANFKVETEAAKSALESQMVVLKESLTAKNLRVESVEIEVSEFDFNQSTEAQAQNEEKAFKGKHRFHAEAGKQADADGKEEAQVQSAETTRQRVMLDAGGSLDYLA